MSAEALGVAWALDDVTPTQKYVAIAVAWLCREEHGHECFPSWGFLASRTKLGQTTCRDAVRELVERGVLYKVIRSRDDGGQTSNWFGFTKLRPPVGSRHPPCREPTPISKEISKNVTSAIAEDDVCDGIGGVLDMLRERGMTKHRIDALVSATIDNPTLKELQPLTREQRCAVFAETVPRLCVDSDLPSAPFIISGIRRTLRERKAETNAGKRVSPDSAARWVE